MQDTGIKGGPFMLHLWEICTRQSTWAQAMVGTRHSDTKGCEVVHKGSGFQTVQGIRGTW